MDGVVAPLLHNNDPVNPEAVKTELPQLLATATVGAAGIALTVSVAGFEFTVPVLFVHTARYCLLLSAIEALKDRVLLVAPAILFQVVPLVLDCHCTVGAGLPLAAELKFTTDPAHAACDAGCKEIAGIAPVLPVLNTTSTQ
jgi:hypothetical protein